MENIIVEKSKNFALKVIVLYKYLCEEKHEYIMSKQLLRSGTSIGANIREAICGQSRVDFRAKMYIALKETNEAEYWLELLNESNYLSHESFHTIYIQAVELHKILSSITKSTSNS